MAVMGEEEEYGKYVGRREGPLRDDSKSVYTRNNSEVY
jgi:hypothetical protein